MSDKLLKWGFLLLGFLALFVYDRASQNSRYHYSESATFPVFDSRTGDLFVGASDGQIVRLNLPNATAVVSKLDSSRAPIQADSKQHVPCELLLQLRDGDQMSTTLKQLFRDELKNCQGAQQQP